MNSFKYLGVYVDNKLKFKTHIEHLTGKMSQLCGVTNQLKKFLNHSSAIKIYYSCVYSVLAYCIAVWGGTLVCTRGTKRLERLQAIIVRNLFGRFSRDGSCLFQQNRILKLLDIYKLSIMPDLLMSTFLWS